MKLAQALNSARGTLTQNNIEDAPLEAELLLRHVLEINRTQLYLDLEKEISPQDEKAFRTLIARRLKGEPSAYITGRREFYGRDFKVNAHTLIPRPESELLVETALRLVQHHRISTIADIGTGCGAIAITLALEIPRARIYATDISTATLEIPNARIYATDISTAALEVAKANCKRHGVDSVRLLQGDMLEPIPEPLDLIVANLPYVQQSELTPDNFEPVIALDGGAKGTEMIAKLCRQAKGRLSDDGTMLLEIGQGQSGTITALLKSLFPDSNIEVFPDLSGIERVVSLSLSKTKVVG